MRQRHTFLLVLIHDDAEPAVLRGRVRHVLSETETAFTSAEQLIALLRAHGQLAALAAEDDSGTARQAARSTG